MELGTTGVWISARRLGAENRAEAAQLVEQLGYGTFWLGSSPRLSDLRAMLETTERIVVGTSIVNVWTYDPLELAAEHAALAADFPERVLVGIGIGHPEAASDYERPFTAMQRFLDALDGADPPLPRERRVLAALAPKMLDLAAARARGAIPYFVPVEHTRYARERLGPEPLLAPELAFVLDGGRDRAREFASLYLGLTNYVANLLRRGFTEEDVADGGSDRLLDAVVPQGGAEEIAAIVRAHLAAGADHVAVQAVGEDGIPRRSWSALAAALHEQ
jgi:probable F420-dependent oxidoreductase